MINKNKQIRFFDEVDDDTCPTVFPILSMCEEDEDFKIDMADLPEELPILALRNMILFPGVAMPILVGREKSLKLIKMAEKKSLYFGAISQKDINVEDPAKDDLYNVGVIAEVLRVIEMPDGSTTAIIQGRQRFRLNEITATEPYLKGRVTLLPDLMPKNKDKEFDVLVSTIQELSLKMMSTMNEQIPREVIVALRNNKNPLYQINFASANVTNSIEEKQHLLEMNDLKERGFRLLYLQHQELQLLELKASIQNRTREEMDKQQKEYYLQQQIKAIQEELGGNMNDIEAAELRKKARSKKWSDEVGEIFEREVKKLERLHQQSPDYSIQLQYLQTIVDLPWNQFSKDNFNLDRAQQILDREHFGLEKVKERIIEHLAVLKLKGDMKSPIICLYGPPGVGKTSLGRSIAESLGRKYVRISLGGVHDEAEIRGHRRTYIGAMSGRIIQSLQKAGTSNPVFVLDEIDKIDNDFKGDPASALLEVLDPEQNKAFHDNYLDIDYDLSNVLFIATANNLSTISQPLRDRMELIEVTGYIAEEKVQIASKHLVPKVLAEHGFKKGEIKFSKKALESIIEDYTRESGVRGLEKQLAKVARKIARVKASGGDVLYKVEPKDLKELLGAPRFMRDKYQGNGYAGVVTGLAWTSVGGEILYVESSLHTGQQSKLTLTGNLGDVMKESAILALDYVRAHASELGITPDMFKDKEVHIHVPEGAIPKDGPSAGITMVTSLVSAITKRKVKSNLAMTGEITLRGKVLPVGGIKEKILAAKRSGITEIILCSENKKDIDEINDMYLKGLVFHYVQDINEVLKEALLDETAE
ncbi:endopeptidase La [Porphyromonas pogonae]|uniref:endopeptidase La n=1 Tax=Porphyromonas pogonae TaxID=867595 RepID=UPI002E76968C|nr:endopeptidase La [Porphyromonas pogonae]